MSDITDDDIMSHILSPEKWYSEEREVLEGTLKLRFRVLSSAEIIEADKAAEVLASTGAMAAERMSQWVARSITHVNGKPIEKSLSKRIEWVHTWPWPFVSECTNQYLEVMQRYAEMVNPDRLKNSPGVPGSTTESSAA